MSIPAHIGRVLPVDTARSWELIAPLLPDSAVLYGGTAIAVQLQHRVSRDLDFFFHTDFDTQAIARALSQRGTFAAAQHSADTLNGIFNATKVQFLRAYKQQPVGPATEVAGIRVAHLRDLMATKLKAVADRSELRDYFDIMALEQTGLSVETGLILYRKRCGLDSTADLTPIVRALGYFGDVGDDPGLPIARDVIEDYWAARQPHIVKALSRPGHSQPRQQLPTAPPPKNRESGAVWVEPHTRADGTTVRGYSRRA